MKLYVIPGTCAVVPHTALEWTGTDYELELLDHDSVKSEEYLRINPQGAVPSIVDGETIVTQNIATQVYVDANYPNANIFGTDKSPDGQAQIMHWLAFLNADLHKAFAPLFGPDGFIEDESAQEKLKDKAKENIAHLLRLPNEQLGKQDYLTGTKTTADIYLYVTLTWAKKFDIDLSAYKNFDAFIKRIEEDEGLTAVIEQQGLEKIGSL
ncbi:glutathione S-transferase [Psychrobacter sp. P2G3]|uniref:glutathione S-transferase family protein n=1 Tax=unclassified Psychrobacter TaxID=196806 RepID=UPI00078E49C3|nr:glutathione S-transferase [Psychrobacter sp. P2G3]AMN50523.1 glutathione S-transferase [Psychrobacter sp. P2G3]